jgi:hypothetical protein
MSTILSEQKGDAMLKAIFAIIAFIGIYISLWYLFQSTGGGVG